MIDSVLILALIVLPGWLSVASSRLHNPRVVDRTAIMQWGILIYHATVIHVISIGLIIILSFVWPYMIFNTLALDRVLINGVGEYAKDSPETGFRVFGCYIVILLIGSALSGTIDLPSKITDGISWFARRIRLADSPVSDIPVWYRVWRLDREKSNKSNVHLRVRIKNEDVYVGRLYQYQLASDLDKPKEIVLGDSILYPKNDMSNEVRLNFSQHGGGGVLLNYDNISSI